MTFSQMDVSWLASSCRRQSQWKRSLASTNATPQNRDAFVGCSELQRVKLHISTGASRFLVCRRQNVNVAFKMFFWGGDAQLSADVMLAYRCYSWCFAVSPHGWFSYSNSDIYVAGRFVGIVIVAGHFSPRLWFNLKAEHLALGQSFLSHKKSHWIINDCLWMFLWAQIIHTGPVNGCSSGWMETYLNAHTRPIEGDEERKMRLKKISVLFAVTECRVACQIEKSDWISSQMLSGRCIDSSLMPDLHFHDWHWISKLNFSWFWCLGTTHTTFHDVFFIYTTW